MPRVAVQFVQLRLETQLIGSPDEHMLAHATFNLTVDGKPEGQHTATIRLTAWSTYEADELEVDRPATYKGPMDYQRFRDAASAYMKSQVGSAGRGFHIAPGASNVTLTNSSSRELGPTTEFDVPEQGGGW